MDLAEAIGFARIYRQSVMVTTRGNGRPQLSNVLHHVDPAGLIRVSITEDRAKFRNLRRDRWVAVHVTRPDFSAYVVIEGQAMCTPAARATDDAAAEELVELYRGLVGEHDDWDAYRRAMVTDRRLVVRITPNRAYGMLPEVSA